MNIKYIVTGGAGFIGSNLVRELNTRGEEDILIVDELGEEGRYTSLLCINRGGLIMGRMLSDYLELPLAVISARYYSKKSQQADRLVLDEKISATDELGNRILVVDDLIGGGDTMRAVTAFVSEVYPKAVVHTGAIFQRPEKNFDVDYFAKISEDWIVFPYEKKEFEE